MPRHQVRQFKPSLVSIADASKVAELKALIADVKPQPESAPALLRFLCCLPNTRADVAFC